MSTAAQAGPTPERLGAGRPLLRGWSHLVAFAVSLLAGPLLVAATPPGARAAIAVYAASVSGLLGVSAAYHRILWHPKPRALMRRLDHAMIFVLIAGTYTAVGALALPGSAGLVRLVWAGAIAGALLQVIWPHAPKPVSAAAYLALGWVAIGALPQLWAALDGAQFALLVLGGVCYSAGALAYATRRPRLNPRVFGYHEVFHALVVAAAVSHFALVASLV